MLKKTPLHNWHLQQGAKMLEFAGFDMPVSYQGVIAEHMAVRQHCGLFDISHMGEIFLHGKDAVQNLQYLTCNDINRLKKGDCQYSMLLDRQGFPVDDIIVYKIDEESFFLCVNAANIQKDFDWISQNLQGDVELSDQSEQTGMIALQGPKSLDLLKAAGVELPVLKRFQWAECKVNDIPVKISKTGYTGELGYEFYLKAEDTLALWEWLIEKGKKFDISPIGLGARDTLRLEMGYALYGHEISASIDPITANLQWVIAWDQGDFIGKSALLERKAKGYTHQVTGLKMEEPGIPREGMNLYFKDKLVGKVLSGTQSPLLKQGIASVLLEKAVLQEQGAELFVDIRGKMKKASFHYFPLIKK